MHRLLKTTILMSCFLLVASCVFTGCKTSPVPIDNILINIEPCMDDPAGDISITNIELTKSTLPEGYWLPPYKKGDLCYLISGQISNNSSTGYWVAYHAFGYYEDNEVAFTLDAGPIMGVAQIFIEPYGKANFTLHLNWVDNVSRFKIFSQKSAQMFP